MTRLALLALLPLAVLSGSEVAFQCFKTSEQTDVGPGARVSFDAVLLNTGGGYDRSRASSPRP